MAGFLPGDTTRSQVRAALGEPLYISVQWGVEVYEGTESRQDWLFANGLMFPLGRYHKPSAMFMVFSPEGLLQGASDLQGQSFELGDLRGLREFQSVILASPEAGAPFRQPAGTPDTCTVMERALAHSSLVIVPDQALEKIRGTGAAQ
jgi:hypothetical protein